MKCLFVHLSDLHIKDTSVKIVVKAEKLVKNLTEYLVGKKACFFVFTGDIAFSGLEAEYQIAMNFMDKIEEYFKSNFENILLQFVFVPGNHDCDFSEKAAIREAVLNDISKDISKALDEDMLKVCLAPQIKYNEFHECYTDPKKIVKQYGLLTIYRFNLSGFQLNINCYNTAWCSKKKETIGKLYFPVSIVPKDIGNSHLTISLLHHPFSWFAQNTKNEFIRAVEKSSHIVLTGHEHDSGEYDKYDRKSKLKTTYIEGGLFNNDNVQDCFFDLLEYDFNGQVIRTSAMGFDGSKCSLIDRSDWHKLEVGIKKNCSMSLKDSYFEFLNDPGEPFVHKRKKILKLDDIFQYPNLKKIRSAGSSNPEKIVNIFSAKSLKSHLDRDKNCTIVANGKAGKTTLAKKLYLEFYCDERFPLLVKGGDLGSRKDNYLLNLVKKECREQYDESIPNSYFQLDKKQRVLIIDDYHKSRLNSDARYKALSIFMELFDIIIIFTEQLSENIPINNYDAKTFSLEDFFIYEICEMGHFCRNEMIENWICLGQEEIIGSEELTIQANTLKHDLDTVLGEGVIPGYPFFIIVIIQSMDSKKNLDMQNGSFGYFYQLLINQALLNSNHEINPDIKNSFLEELARYVYANKTLKLTMEDMKNVHIKLVDKYDCLVDLRDLLNDLVSTLFLSYDKKDYSFKYPFVFYYYVASWMKSNKNTHDFSGEINKMLSEFINNIGLDDYTNMLIFYFYLTKDYDSLALVKVRVDKLFSSMTPCDFDDNVKFLNSSSPTISGFMMGESRDESYRKKHFKQLDKASAGSNKKIIKIEEKPDNSLSTNEQSHFGVINQTVQLVGQILRNFPGSLLGTTKLELVSGCYKAVLRGINYWLALVENNYDSVRKMVCKLMAKDDGNIGEKEQEIVANIVTHHVAMLTCLMQIKTLARALGSEQLSSTYEKIIQADNSVSNQLIDMALKLGHFSSISVRDIVNFHLCVKDNSLVDNMLKSLLLERFYFYEVDFGHRQTLCSKLGIKIDDPRIINGTYRKNKK